MEPSTDTDAATAKPMRSKYQANAKFIDQMRGLNKSYKVTAQAMRDSGLTWAKAGGVASFLREREARRTRVRTTKPRPVVLTALDPYLEEIRALCRQHCTFGQISSLLRGRPGLSDADREAKRIQYFVKVRNTQAGLAPTGQRSVAFVPRRPRSRLVPHTDSILKALADGVSTREIARQHGVTQGAVISFLATRERRLAYEAIWGVPNYAQALR